MRAETTFPFFSIASQAVSTSLRTEVVTDFNQLLGFEDAWSELEEQSASATIFQSFRWIRAWGKAFAKNLDLSTVVVRDGRRIVGILPLLRNSGRLRFMGAPGADYCDCLCVEDIAPDVLATALRTLFKLDGWWSGQLGNLRKDSQFIRCLPFLPGDVKDHLAVSPSGKQSSLILAEDRHKWIAAMRRKPALKRHRNKLYRSGQVCFRHLETRDEAHRFLNVLFEQHIYRRAMAGEHSQFLSPSWRAFYSALLDELDPGKDLRFSILELDGKPLACHLGFESRRSLLLYKPTFDIDAWELSPGDVLLSELLAYAEKQKLDEVDFTIGIEQYKEHFTNYSSDVYCATLHRSCAITSLHQLAVPVLYLTRAPEAKRLFQRARRGVGEYLANCSRVVQGQFKTLSSIPMFSAPQRPAAAGNQSGLIAHSRTLALTDLAALAISHPIALTGRLLRDYRSRLRAGDRCYLLETSNAHHLAWIRRVHLPDESGKLPHDVLYDFRCAGTQKSSALDASTVAWFLDLTNNQGTQACICVDRWDRTSRKLVKNANFHMRKELNQIMRRTRWHN